MKQFEAYMDGQITGGCWAKHTATPEELENLCAATASDALNWSGFPNHLGWEGAIVNSIRPETADDREWGEVAEFWSELEVQDPTEEWLRGFVDGATQVA